MNDENTGTVSTPVEPPNKKRTRTAPVKPFMILTLVQLDLEGRGVPKVCWVDIQAPTDKLKDTASALKYIEETENLPNGRYRVIQLCADQIKNVETIKKTSMRPVSGSDAGE